MATKIMPLGASNTYGMYEDPTSPGGYRGPLWDLLQAQGANVDFVGLDSDGTIGDAHHNGYSGKPIDWLIGPVNETIYDPHTGQVSHTINTDGKPAIHYFIEQAELQATDVILLLAGTNDVRLGDSATTMLAEMKTLLRLIITHPSSPMVQLMKLQPIGGDFWKDDGDTNTTNNMTIAAFNDGLQRIVDELAAELRDTHSNIGVTLVDSEVTASDLSTDGVHLNETGYQKAAQAWYESLMLTEQVALTQASRVNGTFGDDDLRLRSTSGDDIINGLHGSDTLSGGLGNDKLWGDRGDDLLVLDQGNDILGGRFGVDWLKVDGEAGATVNLGLTGSQDTGYGLDTLISIENAWGGFGADAILGTDGSNELKGDAGSDRLSGLGGSDVLHGGVGNDDLDGGTGNDQSYGEDGADTLWLDTGNDWLNGGYGVDWLRISGTAAATVDLSKTGTQSTGYGTDTILNTENVEGGSGADKLYGTEVRDTTPEGNGANILDGKGGSDLIYGRTGADKLIGGAGSDIVYGGAADRAADVFVFASSSESVVGTKRDTIYDFVASIDKLDLSGIASQVAATGNAFTLSASGPKQYSYWYTEGRSETFVRADVTGDTKADFEVRLVSLKGMTADDFILVG